MFAYGELGRWGREENSQVPGRMPWPQAHCYPKQQLQQHLPAVSFVMCEQAFSVLPSLPAWWLGLEAGKHRVVQGKKHLGGRARQRPKLRGLQGVCF